MVGEVDAAPAVVAIDLASSFAVRVSPLDLVGSFDAGEDLIEFRFRYLERVVLAGHAATLGDFVEVQRHTIARLHHHERAPRPGWSSPRTPAR